MRSLILCIPFFLINFLISSVSLAQTHFTANLTAAQENHTVTPDTATGTGAFVLTDQGLEFDITVEGLSGPIAAAHFHASAPVGMDAGVVRGITEFDGNTASGIWTFAEGLDTLLTDLLTGNIYVNVHTAANGAGEIRGQVTLSSGDGFTANLTADQENHTVTPDTATGTASLTLTDAGLVFGVTVEGLSGPIAASHFHGPAPAGMDAGVVRGIEFPPFGFEGSSLNTASGLWTSDQGLDTLLTDLEDGNIYINIHTAANGAGEIRGQVNPVLITSVEPIGENINVPEDFILHQNFPNPFNPSTEIRFNLKQSGPTVLKIYNMLGQEVAKLLNETLQAGPYKVTFEPIGLPSGVYIYRLQSKGLTEARKMLLLK